LANGVEQNTMHSKITLNVTLDELYKVRRKIKAILGQIEELIHDVVDNQN